MVPDELPTAHCPITSPHPASGNSMGRRHRIQITYTSMSSGLSEPQWISPVLFHFDGESIHLRAWSHKHKAYRDYLPIRIWRQSEVATRDRSSPLPFDIDCHSFVRMWIRPRSDFSDAQARVVRLEFGFQENSHITVETRKALALYVIRRWRLNEEKARLELEKIEEVDA